MAISFGFDAEGKRDNEAALQEVTRIIVSERLGQLIDYTIVFSEDVCDGDFRLLSNPALDPCKVLSIWVKGDDFKEYLVKGPIQSHQIKLLDGGQGSELQIKGHDNSIKMKQKEKKHNFHNDKDGDIVTAILQSNGFNPPHVKVEGNGLNNDEDKHSKVQNSDDLTFIRHLAGEHGQYFWISYEGTSGLEVANFRPVDLTMTPVKKLTINAGPQQVSTIDELTINWNTDVPSSIVGGQLDTKTKNNPDPKAERASQFKLADKPLIEVASACLQQGKNSPRPADDNGRAQQRSKGALNEAEWFIRASFETRYDRICQIIHAHSIIEISGAGARHSGKYLVSGVTHTLDASSYKMQVELMRNAWN